MSLRQRLPFAMLFTLVALAVPPGSCPSKPKPAAPAPLVPVQLRKPDDLAAGKLLVAGRGLHDPNFAETVVLLTHYDEKGVLGLVLNRRTNLPISRVLDLEAAKNLSAPVYLGGPVELSTVFALMQSATKIDKADPIFAGVYLISDKDLFEKTIAAHPDPRAFHVYLGYAGWTQAQLRAEVQLGAWFIFPADAASVFNSDPDSLWPKMIQKTELHWAIQQPIGSIVRAPS